MCSILWNFFLHTHVCMKKSLFFLQAGVRDRFDGDYKSQQIVTYIVDYIQTMKIILQTLFWTFLYPSFALLQEGAGNNVHTSNNYGHNLNFKNGQGQDSYHYGLFYNQPNYNFGDLRTQTYGISGIKPNFQNLSSGHYSFGKGQNGQQQSVQSNFWTNGHIRTQPQKIVFHYGQESNNVANNGHIKNANYGTHMFF